MEDDYDEEPLNHGTDPAEVLQEAEQQWLYTEEELLHTPSIRDGMSPEEERQLRSKGTNFITQVGIMLKLPQMTLSTASIFFNRFLMRRSLVKKEGYKPLHHYVRPSKLVVDDRSYFGRLSPIKHPRPLYNTAAHHTNYTQQIAATALFLATGRVVTLSKVEVGMFDTGKAHRQ